MQKKFGVIVGAVALVAGCAEYQKPLPNRALAHQASRTAVHDGPLTTQSITVAPGAEMSLEEQLNAAWKNICGLRNVEHAEKRRVSETEAQKHCIDEKCADVRRDSHMQ